MLFSRKKVLGAQPVRADLPPPDQIHHVHEAENVLNLAVVLSQQSDFQEILRLIASKGLPLFNADTITILMVNPKTQHTIKTIMRNGTDCDDRLMHLLRVNITGWVMKHGEPFLSADLSREVRFSRDLFAGSVTDRIPIILPRQTGQVYIESPAHLANRATAVA